MSFSNSGLVTCARISPNKNSPRNHKIDTITIHCVVGQFSAMQICQFFTRPAAQASCNYCIGKDGEVGLCVEEQDRSWCSSNAANDHRAITIECASDTNHPYAINEKVYNTLIKLCSDICRRNGIPKLLWKADKSLIGHIDKQNMTVHRWFANKSCPGDYIYSRLGEIASEVNKRLSVKIDKDKKDFRIRFREPIVAFSDYGKSVKEGVYTIKEVSPDGNYGFLKSGFGWVRLSDGEIIDD